MRQGADFSLYLVIDSSRCTMMPLEETVAAAVRGGVTMVQLREKTLETRKFVECARQLRALLAPLEIPLIINDRVDIALAVRADGIHVGQTDMRVQDVRALIGGDAIVGITVETPEQIEEANALDIDYIGISPVFSTPSIPRDVKPWQIPGVRKARSLTTLPIVGFEGITTANAAQVIAAGADGVAVVSAICGALSPKDAAEELRKAAFV
jgi:thiamine-phosphate pyrophosphorylase